MPAAAGFVFLLEVLRATLQQPEQLLQQGAALVSQSLSSADPGLERCLGWEGTAWITAVALEANLDVLYAVS